MHLRERERDTLADISERDLNVQPDNYVLFIELENMVWILNMVWIFNFECGARIWIGEDVD